MSRAWRKLTLSGLITLFLVGCGKSNSGPSVSATASFFNGATGVSARSESPAARRDSRPAPVAGNWLLSPDKMTLTLSSIQLSGGGGGATASISTNCTVTYDRSQAGLTKLGDCPFTVAAGTYTGINVSFSSTYQVLFNGTDGFYSTASGIVTAKPVSGAQNLTVTTTSSGSSFGNQSYFQSPVTIAAGGAPVTLSIVVSGIQFFHANVDSGGNVTFGWPGTNYTDPFRPDMTASVTSLAKLGFYVDPRINTYGSYNVQSAGVTGISSATVFYSAATTPTFLILGLNGTPGNCGPIGVAGVVDGAPSGNGLGGYLGLDSNGVLGWAVPTDNTWTKYAAEFSMPQVSTLGAAATTLKCKNISNDPAPSGGTFSSGAPIITTADYTTSLALVAH